MDILIRPVLPEDAPALAAIYEYYVNYTAISFEYDAPGPEEFQRRIGEKLAAGYPYLVAQEGDRLLGYAYAGPMIRRPAYDWIAELTVYLDRAERGRGVGTRLYGALLEELKAMGVQSAAACIADTDRADDPYLTRGSPLFHGKMGFTEVGRFRSCGYKFDRWYDMIWMEKVLGDHPTPAAPVRRWRE